MDSQQELAEYLDEIRTQVCSRCIEKPPGGPPCAPLGKRCGIELNLRGVVDAIHSIKSNQIDPYINALHDDVCSHCAIRPTNQCPCSLEYLLPLVVQAVETVDERFGQVGSDNLGRPCRVAQKIDNAMGNEGWAWSAAWRMPSRHGAGEAVEDDILDQMRKNDWVEHDAFGVRLALEEALVNAIIHGNGLCETKQVLVSCKMSRDRLCVRISDEGPGFCPADVPDPTDAANLERPCGRGLLLMRSLMSRVEFNTKGNCVEMTKVRAGGHALPVVGDRRTY